MSDSSHIDYFEVFPWNQNFETGHQEIDEQHKKLVLLLNQLANTLIHEDSIEVSEAFGALSEYAGYHFQSEEGIWRACLGEDKMLAEHRKSHVSFLPKVLEIKKKHADKPLVETVEHIIKFLIRWLAFHIIDDDKRLSIIVNEMNAGKSLQEAKDISNEKMSGSIRVLIETVLSMYDGLSSRTLNLMRERNARIKAEESLKEANKKLEKFNAHLEEMVEQKVIAFEKQEKLFVQQSKMAEMGEMISAIAHQWKQPLNVINIKVGEISFLYENGELNEEMIDNVTNSVSKQVKFMSETINDFRNFVKPEKVETSFNLEAEIRILVNMFGDSFKKQNIGINITEHEKVEVNGHPNEFKQVVLSILNNARDIIIHKKIDPGLIECVFEINDEKGIVKIRDNGGGIPAELLPDRLFEPYITTKGDKGTGIGLQIAKMLIEHSMQGKLWVHNVNQGAEFVIELPLAK